MARLDQSRAAQKDKTINNSQTVLGKFGMVVLKKGVSFPCSRLKAAAQAMKGVRSSKARQVARNAVKRVGGFTCNGFTPLLIALRAIRAIVFTCTRLIVTGRTTPLVPFTRCGFIPVLFALRAKRVVILACAPLTLPTGIGGSPAAPAPAAYFIGKNWFSPYNARLHPTTNQCVQCCS